MEQQYKSSDDNNPTLDVTLLSQLSGGELWVAALCHTHTQLSAGIRIATHCTSPARLHLAATMISHLLHRGVIVSTGLHNDTMLTFNVLKDSYGPPPGIVRSRWYIYTTYLLLQRLLLLAAECWHQASISNGVKHNVQCPRFQATVFFVGVQLCCHHCYLHPHYVMSDTTVQTFFFPFIGLKVIFSWTWDDGINGRWVIYYQSAAGPCLQCLHAFPPEYLHWNVHLRSPDDDAANLGALFNALYNGLQSYF